MENVTGSYGPEAEMDFYNLFMQLGQEQIVKVPTNFPSKNILDHCLCCDPERIGYYEVLPLSLAVVMESYCFSMRFILQKSLIAYPMKKDWSRGSCEQMRAILQDIDWDYEFRYLDAVTI